MRAAIARCCRTRIGLSNKANAGIALDNIRGVVGRAIVDDNNFYTSARRSAATSASRQ